MPSRRKKKSSAGGGIFSPDARSLYVVLGWVAAAVVLFQLQLFVGSDHIIGKANLAVLTLVASFLVSAGVLYSQGRLVLLSLERAFLLGLVPALMIVGAFRATIKVSDFLAVVPIAAANLVLWYLVLGPRLGMSWKDQMADLARTDTVPEWPAWVKWLAGVAATLVVAQLILGIRAWALSRWTIESSDFQWLYVPRWRAFSGVPGDNFNNWPALKVPIFYFVEFSILFALLVWRQPSNRVLLLSLFAAAVAGKYAVAYISASGLHILEQKITAEHNNFYTIAVRIIEGFDLFKGQGLWNYLTKFTELMPLAGNQQETHPFGGAVFYWGLVKIFGKNPGAIAHFMVFFCTLAIIPLFYIVLDIAKSRWIAFAAVVLYISSPMNLQLSGAGIEPVVSLLALIYFWILNRALEKNSWKWAFAAGVVNYVCALVTFGTNAFAMFCCLWGFWVCYKNSVSATDWFRRILRTVGPFLLAFPLGLLLTWALLAGQFSYIDHLANGASRLARNTSGRPYELWVWANVVLYAGYAGVSVVALYLLQVARRLWAGEWWDAFLVLSVGSHLLFILTAMGRAENQHNMMWADILLVIPAAWFLKAAAPEKGVMPRFAGGEIHPWLLLVLAGFNFINMLVLEIKVLDFW